jgi:hypothetical protein
MLLAITTSASPAAAYLDMSAAQTMYETNGNLPATTAAVGGNGGAGLYVECGNFKGTFAYLGGINVEAGNWIDGIAPECAQPQESQGELRLPQPRPTNMWGGNGGSFGIDACAPDEAVGGLRLQRSPNNFVGYIALLCRPLNDLASVHPTNRSFGRISNKSPPVQDVVCPAGMIGYALFGGYGVYIDRLGLGCLPPPKVIHETILSGMEDNTDRPGADYRAYPTNRNPAECQSDCLGYSGKCLAWTYVRPGIQGPGPVCHLKSAAPAAVPNDCCISGTVRSPSTVYSEPPRAISVPHSPSDVYSRKTGDGAFGVPTHSSSGRPVVGEPGGFAGPAPTMTGTFDTDFGVLVLTSRDGMYSVSNGRVTIEHIYGDFMDGSWTQSKSEQQCTDGTYRGHFHFRFTSKGFTGSYGYCDGPANAGRWNGTQR